MGMEPQSEVIGSTVRLIISGDDLRKFVADLEEVHEDGELTERSEKMLDFLKNSLPVPPWNPSHPSIAAMEMSLNRHRSRLLNTMELSREILLTLHAEGWHLVEDGNDADPR